MSMDALQRELERHGVRVQANWLAACLRHLQAADNVPEVHTAKLVFHQLLQNDLNICGAPALPQYMQGLHDTVLPGRLLLQVDEVVNIGATVQERYSGNDGSSRCLKLLLTDGVQQVAAMEYRPTPALHSAMPAGSKLVVQGALVRRGILLLTPQCCALLGGEVSRLEEARQRMLAHWTQPAVGRRGPPPTMQQAMAEASRAAWAAGPTLHVGPHPPPQHMVQGPEANQQPPRHAQERQNTAGLNGQQQQQQQQRIGSETSGRVQGGGPPPAAAAAPLQEHNRNAAPSETQRRSRLALPKPPTTQQEPAGPPFQQPGHVPPAAADFAFAEPLQQHGGPNVQPAPRLVQVQASQLLLQRLRQGEAGSEMAAAAAADNLAAGTNDDPICFSDDEQQQAPPGGGGGQAVDVEMADAADAVQQAGKWQADDELDWEDELPPAPHLDLWEQGFDGLLPDVEQQAEDADAPLRAGGSGGNDGDSLQAAANVPTSSTKVVPLTGDEVKEEQQQQQPAAAAIRQAAAEPAAAAQQSLRRRCSGRAAEQVQPQLGSPADGAARSPKQPTNRLSGSKAVEQQAMAAGTPHQVQQQDPSAAVPQLAAPDPNLLNVAPSLAQVLFSNQSTPSPLPHTALPAASAVAASGSRIGAPGAAGRTPNNAEQLATGHQQRPAVPSLLRLQQQQSAAGRHAAAANSDEDMPSFDLLPDLSPPQQQHKPAAVASSMDEPFIYLLQLNQRAASAGPEAFPLSATIFGTVKEFVGRMWFKDPVTGQPQYGMALVVEDGSMAVRAQMGPQLMHDFFDLEPQEFEARLRSTDTSQKHEVVELAKGLQKVLSTYSGLMAVKLEAPGQALEVRDLLVDLTAEQVAALQRRAAM